LTVIDESNLDQRPSDGASTRESQVRDVSGRNQETELLGKTYASPFGIAPLGGAAFVAYRGDLVLAAAATRSTFDHAEVDVCPGDQRTVRLGDRASLRSGRVPGRDRLEPATVIMKNIADGRSSHRNW
jgi:hypothetical protein